jgi:hypothetical protein
VKTGFSEDFFEVASGTPTSSWVKRMPRLDRRRPDVAAESGASVALQ